MCGPPAIAGIGLFITAVSAVASYKAADDSAQTTENFQDASAKEGARLARESFDNQNKDVQARSREEDSAAAQAIRVNQQEAAKAKATARVASGEAGVSGLSVDALLSDFNRQEDDYTNSILTNRDISRRQSQQALKGIRAGTESQLAASRFAPVRRPSYLTPGLQIAGAGLAAGAQYRDLNDTNRS